MQKQHLRLIFNIVLFIVCIVLLYKTLFKDLISISLDNEAELRKEIDMYANQAHHWQTIAIESYNKADSALKIVDSLSHLKPTIKYKYEKIYKFNEHVTDKQLDSIIRNNW